MHEIILKLISDMGATTMVVLIVMMPGDACADELDRFEPTGDGWLTPVFVYPPTEQACRSPLWSWTHVVAVDRQELDGMRGFRLPADQTYGYPDAEAPIDL